MNSLLIMQPRHLASRLVAGLWLLLFWLALSLSAHAQNVPARPDPPHLVNDLAGLLQPQEVTALEQKLVAYNDSTSSQIAVVTVPTLDGNDIADYAQKLYESWGIGRKGKDNGVLVLVAVKEHDARIQTGYGMEGAIPDALAKRIISNTLVPAFQQKNYYAGLDRATDQLIALAKGEYKADPADAQRQGGSRDNSGSGPGFWIIIGVLVLFFILRSRGGGGRGGRGGGFIAPIIFGDFSGGRGCLVAGAASAVEEAGVALAASGAAAAAAAAPAAAGSNE
ncbi:TPM domain-containing protein [Hymenobacter sp. BRD67]|uniref:TPM domain-containing protein n=1 Tax=Hymenobacter sp. BRD67 TaxID=2675877 RepID=UPI00293B878C|nr:TPM domain-containing protein [Hymenobacter sp. BRD67]